MTVTRTTVAWRHVRHSWVRLGAAELVLAGLDYGPAHLHVGARFTDLCLAEGHRSARAGFEIDAANASTSWRGLGA